jgi:hypothetical protein
MKHLILFVLSIVTAINSLAQKDTFDLVAFTAPKKWTKSVAENVVSFTIENKKSKEWCRINIVKSTISKGSIEQDFESEWQELVVKSFKSGEASQTNEIQQTDGWKIKTGGAKFTFNNGDAIAMLTTMSGFERCVSIVALTNSKVYIKDIEALLSSVNIKKPETAALPATKSNGNTSVIGTWGIGTTTASFYNTSINEGSIIIQYTFKANGTYSFYVKTFRYLLTTLLLTRETGTYQVSGSTITIIPQRSAIESWSRKNGTDQWGKLLSSQKRDLEKVTYQFLTEDYGSGMVLVLKAGKETKRDGYFNNSSKDAWFYPSKSSLEFITLP